MNGFTLLEVVVTVTIISFLTFIVTSALPVARRNQALNTTRQYISYALQQAQHQAINEVRSAACVRSVIDSKRCSDVGVAVRDNRLVIFADTASPQDWHYTEGQDYLLSTVMLPASVALTDRGGTPVTRWRSWVFVGIPPTLQLYVNENPSVNGTPLMTDQISILMLLSGPTRLALTISPYGQVE